MQKEYTLRNVILVPLLEHSNIIEVHGMCKRHTILEIERISTLRLDLNLRIQVLEGDIRADLRNVKHILVIPEDAEQSPRRGRRREGVHGIEERDDVLFARGRIQRLGVRERRSEGGGRARRRSEEEETGGRPAVCGEVVDEHVVVSLIVNAGPEVAGLVRA